MRESVINYVIQRFCHFERCDINPGNSYKEAISVFLAWTVPAFIFVLWASNFYPEVKLYHDAITEGIGPNLWNVIGSFGFFSFGIAMIFSNHTGPALVADKVLSNAYAIGCLNFGLLSGQWCFLLSTEDLIWWQRGFFGVTSGLLMVIVFFYNFILWYLSFFVKNEHTGKSVFLTKLGQVHLGWRVSIGLTFNLIVSLIFLTES
ncbi:hypothetical protein CAG70_10410 [Photobacterium halotolerans]|nr:hypothetical protein [Photobacterium halotolerans]NAX47410.1 hypothetical protein [Photobacterium halotolerans]